jgi:hypothetical protein
MRDIAKELMGSVNHLLAEHIERWINYDQRCQDFLESNKPKVSAKIRDAAKSGPDRLLNLLFELQMGCLLSLHPSLVPSYEYFGSGNLGPDYTMLNNAAPEFNVEVTQLNEAALDVEFERWIDSIAQSVPKMDTGAMISLISKSDERDFVPLNMENKEIYREREEMLARMRLSTADVVAFIADRTQKLAKMDGRYEYVPVPGFEGDLELFIMKQTDLTNLSALVSNSVISFFKVHEPLRIVSVVCEKLGSGQLQAGMQNVLAIYNLSRTMQRWHVPLAFKIMREAAEKGDDAFFSGRRHSAIFGAQDYLDKSKNLTGIWYRTNYHTEKAESGEPVWIEDDELTEYTANDETNPLAHDAVEFLKQLPHISGKR